MRAKGVSHIAVCVRDRERLLDVHVQSLSDHLFHVVGPLNERRPATVADPGRFRRLVVHVVDRRATRADPSRAV